MDQPDSQCRQCGGELVSDPGSDGCGLICNRCRRQVSSAPILGVWPFSAAVAPRGARPMAA